MEDHTTFTKVFVGRLAMTSNETSLRNYFQQFGNIVNAVVIINRITRRSKGYGFVNFVNPEDAQAACRVKHPYIDGSKVICIPAKNQPSQLSPPTHENATRMQEDHRTTVYVRGIKWTTSLSILFNYFQQFGNILKIVIETDTLSATPTPTPTGFAFVIFSHPGQAQAACVNPVVSIDGVLVSCKISFPITLRSQNSPPNHATSGPTMHSPSPYTHPHGYPNYYPMGYNYYYGGPNGNAPAPSGYYAWVPYNAPASDLENDDNR